MSKGTEGGLPGGPRAGQGEPQVISNSDPLKSFLRLHASGPDIATRLRFTRARQEDRVSAVRRESTSLSWLMDRLDLGRRLTAGDSIFDANDDPALHGVIPLALYGTFLVILAEQDKDSPCRVSFELNEQLLDLL